MKEQFFDPIRKKHITLTPEEKVRQGTISWLINIINVPSSHIACEYPLNFNGRKFRADILVFDKRLEPVIIIECKSASVAINNSVAEQMAIYNKILKVKYLVITNGNIAYFFLYDKENSSYKTIHAIPNYNTL